MFDIGWPELMVIAVLTIILVGPQELPRVLRTVMGVVRKIRMVAGEFQNSMEDIAREADLQDIKKQMSEIGKKDLQKEFENAVDPAGEINKSVQDMQQDVDSWKAKANMAPSDSLPKTSETAEADSKSAGEASTENQAKSS